MRLREHVSLINRINKVGKLKDEVKGTCKLN